MRQAAALFDDNYRFDYSGPWPPYNFVDVDREFDPPHLLLAAGDIEEPARLWRYVESGGNLILNGHAVIVPGNFATAGTGTMTMTNAADSAAPNRLASSMAWSMATRGGMSGHCEIS